MKPDRSSIQTARPQNRNPLGIRLQLFNNPPAVAATLLPPSTASRG